MGFRAYLKIAKRSLVRRKTKNISAILAITLGVTLMVGIQITTDTLENSFLTSLLLREGEVDIRISNATGNYLTIADQSKIDALVPNALGIMPELTTRVPAMVGSQFEPSVELAGIQTNFSKVFGSFYEWKTGKIMNISHLLTDDTSILISSRLAKILGINDSIELPISLTTEFNNITLTMLINETTSLPIINQTTGQPIFTRELSIERVQLDIKGIYDSFHPGIGSRYRGFILSLETLQTWMSLQDPFRKTDIIGSYLISFKSDHFTSEINENYLQEQYDALIANIPIRIENGNSIKIYSAESARLIYFQVIKTIFNLMSSFLTTLGLLIIITGILLITNVQLMSVEDREFQTGVMRAVGENRRGIFQTMLIETLFQGILGGIFGLIGGLIFGQVVALYIANLFGTGRFSVQPIIKGNVVILSVIIGVILGIVTGLLPAVRASRVNIVEALRGIRLTLEEKSGRNLTIIGILLCFIGGFFLLSNGVFNTHLNYIWDVKGWDSIEEWENILLGAGFSFSGLGIILSRYIDRTKAFNLTSFVLWATPVFLFIIAMGEGWISDLSEAAINILIISIVEIVIGSVLLVGINLSPLMTFLRNSFMKIRGLKGVAQVAPALISSHKVRSTLTFAIFAVVLTLNVTVATLVATNIESSIGQSEEDSRGIDLYVSLSKPEPALESTSYTEKLYEIDSSIYDVIAFKTFNTMNDFSKFVSLENPISPKFDPQSDLLPLGYGEIRSDQIRGNASNAYDNNWRYDYYLRSFPDGVRKSIGFDASDEELLDLSKKAWDSFFDPSYKMAAYNLSFDFTSFEFGGRFGGNELEDVEPLKNENGTIIKNPIVFTDSFILPLGLQIWIPMNTSDLGYTIYQSFTIGGILDNQRASGFPLSKQEFMSGTGEFSGNLGNIYIPEHYSKFTNFLGSADGISPISRNPSQYDTYLIKTDYSFDDQHLEIIAQKIELYTNTEDFGYRKVIGDNFIVATAKTLYSKIRESLEMMETMTSFLQIYVNFGLIIGAVGMAVISVRNVAERRREIGMMRAIGFPRLQVMLSALLELVVLGLIGLIIGVINGLIVNIGFANMLDVTIIIPWETIALYLSFITIIGLLAGAIPGWVASRIPAAEALRYVG